MTTPDLAALFARLDDARQKSHDLFAGIAPETPIYLASGWRFKDILTHLTVWEEEATAALEAHLGGAAYPLPCPSRDLLDDFNGRMFAARKDYPLAQVLDEWAAARERLKTAFRRLGPELLAGEMLFPWGQRGTPERTLHGVVWHEEFHRTDVLVATGRKTPDAEQE